MEQKVIENVLNNETLTSGQKEDVLDAAQADMKAIDSILELERKRQEMAIQQVFGTDSASDAARAERAAEVEAELLSEQEAQKLRFEEEKLQLQRSLEEERSKKLDDMMEGEVEVSSGGASAAGSAKMTSSKEEEERAKPPSVDGSKVQALAESRLAAVYRLWAYSGRLRYKELVLRFNVERLKLQISKYEISGTSTKGSNALHVQDCEDRLDALDTRQERDLLALSAEIEAALAQSLAAEAARREEWLKDAQLDVEAAANAFVREFEQQFVAISQSGKLKALSSMLKEANKLERELKIAMFKSHAFSGGDQRELKAVLESSKAEMDQSNDLVLKMQQEDLRVLYAEEALLLQVLEHPTTRPEKADELDMLSQLHLRVLGAMNVDSTLRPRLAMVEVELEYEAKVVRLSNQMLKQAADKGVIEAALHALFEKKRLDAVEVLAALQNKFVAEKAVEKRRQEALTSPSFEKERALAIEQHALREAQTAVDVSRSQRRIQVRPLHGLILSLSPPLPHLLPHLLLLLLRRRPSQPHWTRSG
jgi:hypothetical protein